jgi:hypothetical protein
MQCVNTWFRDKAVVVALVVVGFNAADGSIPKPTTAVPER